MGSLFYIKGDEYSLSGVSGLRFQGEWVELFQSLGFFHPDAEQREF